MLPLIIQLFAQKIICPNVKFKAIEEKESGGFQSITILYVKGYWLLPGCTLICAFTYTIQMVTLHPSTILIKAKPSTMFEKLQIFHTFPYLSITFPKHSFSFEQSLAICFTYIKGIFLPNCCRKSRTVRESIKWHTYSPIIWSNKLYQTVQSLI